MKTLSSNLQFKRLKNKGIIASNRTKVFNDYSYYQLINGYKPVFIEKTLTLNEIKDILNDSTHTLYEKILSNFEITRVSDKYSYVLVRLNEKYGLEYSTTEILKDVDKRVELEEKINRIDYRMHLYKEGVHVDHFIQILKFEHELRNVLLKYCLIIEENIKNIFTDYLNSQPLIESTFLLNAKNYNINQKGHSAIKSMSFAVDAIADKNILSLQKKKDQNVLAPYWMVIHSFFINKVIKTIDNLNVEYSKNIKENILFGLSNKDRGYYESNGYDIGKDADKLFKAISDIGHLRNMLAHNSPIFLYNVSKLHFYDNRVEYKVPFVRARNQGDINVQKSNAAKVHIENLERILDCEYPDANNRHFNLNLSYAIFIVVNIICSIDENSKIKKEIKDIFQEFKIVGTVEESENYILNEAKLNELIWKIDNIVDSMNKMDLGEVRNDFIAGNAIVRKLQQKNNICLNSIKDLARLKNDLLNIKKTEDDRYESFPFSRNFFLYTGINNNFIKSL